MTNGSRLSPPLLLATFGLLALIPSVTGCPRKRPDPVDAGGGDAPMVQLDASLLPEAANESEVTRFPDETKLDHVATVTQAAATNVRKAPPSGAVIVTLAKSTPVQEIAQRF